MAGNDFQNFAAASNIIVGYKGGKNAQERMSDTETIIRSMILREYPDFGVVFEDPMFAFVFRATDFDSWPRLVFCTVDRVYAGDHTIEMVNLRHMPCRKFLNTPTQSLLEQLQAIKALLHPETSALRFSEISRELVVAKSNMMFDLIHAEDPDFTCTFESFDVRYTDSFLVNDFHALVEKLSVFVMSSNRCKTFLKNGCARQAISSSVYVAKQLLWVEDDDFILVLEVPKGENCMDGGAQKKGYMHTKTWNETFGDVPGACCKNAGVVFGIVDDTIRYMYHRNLNAPFDPFHCGPDEPIVYYSPVNEAAGELRTAKIEMKLKHFHPPYIADGTMLRKMVETTVKAVDPLELKLNTRTILYLCTAAIHLKNRYNLCLHMNSDFFALIRMFKLEYLDAMLENWTGYISGQHSTSQADQKFKGSENMIFSYKLHRVAAGNAWRDREISWQFSYEPERRLSVYEWRYCNLPKNDLPGGALDLRTRDPTPLPDRLLRIDTGLL